MNIKRSHVAGSEAVAETLVENYLLVLRFDLCILMLRGRIRRWDERSRLGVVARGLRMWLGSIARIARLLLLFACRVKYRHRDSLLVEG